MRKESMRNKALRKAHKEHRVSNTVLRHILTWCCAFIVIEVSLLFISCIPLHKSQIEMQGIVQSRSMNKVDEKYVYDVDITVNGETFTFHGSHIYYASENTDTCTVLTSKCNYLFKVEYYYINAYSFK